MARIPFLFAFSALAVLGCGPSNDELRAKLDSRSKFDLQCQNLMFTPLERTRGYVTTYGVEGCGHRATYVLNAATVSWVMNASDGKPISAPTGEPPPPAPPPPPPPPVTH